MDANKYKLTLDNQKIWNFYNSNPGIDIETANLFFIDFFENIFNHTTRTSENINSQILSFMSDSKKQIELLQMNLASVNENVTKINNLYLYLHLYLYLWCHNKTCNANIVAIGLRITTIYCLLTIRSCHVPWTRPASLDFIF